MICGAKTEDGTPCQNSVLKKGTRCQHHSIDDQISELLDNLPPMEELKQETDRLLKCLSPLEELVLRMRFGVGEGSANTLAEVARGLHVTSERIRKIEEGAHRKLRQARRQGPQNT